MLLRGLSNKVKIKQMTKDKELPTGTTRHTLVSFTSRAGAVRLMAKNLGGTRVQSVFQEQKVNDPNDLDARTIFLQVPARRVDTILTKIASKA